jgi:valyl-tRNA synthetase
MKSLPKIYQPQEFEQAVYQKWEASGFFNPDNLPGKRKKTFSIVLPPPNVTGVLHIGHASMLAYQDIIIRYHRMKGDKTLWLPGTDHAAIATQTVVEKKLLKAEGKHKEELGRTEFRKRVDAFVEQSKGIIRKQLKAMGSSLDWSRERFTLDEDLSLAVKTAFKKMYDDNLIYRGDRVVNWCPSCKSTLADDEVEYQEQNGQLYFIKYGPVTIATTRPETKLGDTGLAVNPKDKRYKNLVGRELEVDLAGHKIKVKVFADRAVDMEFGTGAIGVTPAHSQTDYQWAGKYGLKLIKVIDEEGKMTAAAGQYAGLTVARARERLVEDLEKAELLEKIEDYKNNLSLCYRCGSAVEPLPSKQWFIDVNKKIPGRGKSLKQLASEAVKKNKIKIIPDRFNKTYFQWMDNLRDWCVSRQIWYGHRIPVWYRNKELLNFTRGGQGTGNREQEVYVGLETPKGDGWIQDEDTLDTWFSSGLWTFSTLGWPEKTKDLKNYHPTSVMETGYDILFFWVARMILMSTYLAKEVPFATVYLHGLVRDKEGRKMSKSLGNGIDPLEMIDKFGTDALRLSMITGTSAGSDIRLYEEKIAGYRNFVNKLWNISRYILSSINQVKTVASQPDSFSLADEWILAEFNRIVKTTTQNLEQFKFSQAAEELYEFTWSKLADWYLEIAKLEGDKDEILLYLLENLLKLWHPFCPFVTEVLWESFGPEDLLMIQEWPKSKIRESQIVNRDFSLLRELITAVRNIRAENKINAKQIINITIKSKEQKLIEANKVLIEGLAKVKLVEKVSGISSSLPRAEIILDIKADPELEKLKSAEIKNLQRYVEIQTKKLSDKSFIKKAPAEIIEKEKRKLTEARVKLDKLK